MRASTLLLLLPVFGASEIIYVLSPPPDSPDGPLIPAASPASPPRSNDPIQTAAAIWAPDNLELRQAPAAPAAPAPGVPPAPAAPAAPPAVPPANPAVPGVPANPPAPGVPVPPAVPGAPNIPPAPAVPPAANPAPPAPNPATTTTTSATPASGPAKLSESVTVQWVETWIDGSQTWNPHTITYRYLPFVSQAPQPGVGEIGMGTLTGGTGKTRTLVMGGAAAKATQVPAWGKGVAAVVGVGLAGVIV